MRFFESTRRIVVTLAAVLGVVGCTGSNLGATTEDVLSTNLTTYTSGNNVIVNYSNMSGSTTDWISLAQTSDPANVYEAWQYTGGGTSGSLTFTAPDLPAGTYEARAYYDWQDTNSFTIQQTSPSFTVTGGTSPTVTTDQLLYSPGQTVTLSYANMPGNQYDWVAVATAGAPVTSVVAWFYTNGQVSGSQAFTGLTSGNYEARAYVDNKYDLVATSTFSVTGATTITTDQPTYTPGQTVTVIYSNMPGNPADYVAVSIAGSPANSIVAQAPTNGQINGSAPFSGLAAGNYEARAYSNGTFTILATSTFSIAAAATPTVTTDSSSYSVGQTVTVTYSGMPGNSTDWISIATEGSPDTSYVMYVFTGGAINGTAQFTGLVAGTYEARAYPDNTYMVIARSAPFTVAGSTCTPPTQMPQLGSVASGDLVISSTQQSNSVAMTVPLASSVLFMSLSEDEMSPDFGAVICELHADDPDLGPAGVTCIRNDVGTDTPGSTGQITVHYTVATFTSGVTVQRGTANTATTDPTDVTLTSVDPTSSFVLLSGMVNGGTGWGNNEFVRAQLLNATTLDLQTNVAGTFLAWQVVSMTGASVQRGTTSFATADVEHQVAISAVPSGTLVLASYTTDNSSGIAAAALMMQSSLTSPNTLDLKRVLGGSNLDVSWEVVSLPYATLYGTSTFTTGQTSQAITLGSISASSSVAIASSQAILGQSCGSTDYNGTDADLVGEGAATLSTGSGSLTVQRQASQSNATIPWTVIDFSHNCAGM